MDLPLNVKIYGTPGIDPWVRVFENGAIKVLHGHSLSKYSKAIYGDFEHIDEFWRQSQDDALIEIRDKNLIRIGETVIWKPQHDYFKKMTGDRSSTTYTVGPDSPPQWKGAEIIALDPSSDESGAGFLESMFTFGEVHFTDVKGFVDGVLNALGNRQIGVLHVQVHGSPHGRGIAFGPRDMVHEGAFQYYKPQFQRLAGRFRPDGWVFFRACFGGQYHVLMRQFRDLWRCNVISGLKWQSNWVPGGDFNHGSYYVVTAGGHEYVSKLLPPNLRHSNDRRAARWILGE